MGTFTNQEVIDTARSFLKGIPITSVDSQVIHVVNAIIHRAAPWRWTTSEITPLTLVDGTQDYLTTSDTDFWRLVSARVARTDVTPDKFRELVVKTSLPKELEFKAGFTELVAVAHQKTIDRYRLDHAARVPTSVTLELQGEYQRVAKKITDSEMVDVIEIDDDYFDVFVAGVMWKLMSFANDKRAGIVQRNRDGSTTYTGQMGVFYSALLEMMEAEDWGVGETLIPVDPLGVPTGPDAGSIYFS